MRPNAYRPGSSSRRRRARPATARRARAAPRARRRGRISGSAAVPDRPGDEAHDGRRDVGRALARRLQRAPARAGPRRRTASRRRTARARPASPGRRSRPRRAPTCPARSPRAGSGRGRRAPARGARSICTRSGVTSHARSASRRFESGPGRACALRFRTRIVSSICVGLLAASGSASTDGSTATSCCDRALEVEQPGDRRVAVAHGSRRPHEQAAQIERARDAAAPRRARRRRPRRRRPRRSCR